jgi:hypothetical protein
MAASGECQSAFLRGWCNESLCQLAGDANHDVAKVLKAWLLNVIQAVVCLSLRWPDPHCYRQLRHNKRPQPLGDTAVYQCISGAIRNEKQGQLAVKLNKYARPAIEQIWRPVAPPR